MAAASKNQQYSGLKVIRHSYRYPKSMFVSMPVRRFAAAGGPQVDIANFAGAMAGHDIQNKKINTRTLCDLIGSKYY